MRSRVAWWVVVGVGTLLPVLRADEPSPQTTPKELCVLLIGGIDSDPSADQLAGTALRGQGQCGMYQLAGDIQKAGLTAEYFNWNGTRAGKIKEKPPQAAGIAKFIVERRSEKPAERFAIIANSWGGHTAWEVCRSLDEPSIPIEMVVFLDPSSAARANTARPSELPQCVKSARNYYTRNVFGWREWPNEPRLKNIDLGDAQHGFLVQGGPRYDAAFDVQAHIAAEWDSRIHDEITRHVVELLKTNSTTRQ